MYKDNEDYDDDDDDDDESGDPSRPYMTPYRPRRSMAFCNKYIP